ncbi:MAG: lipoprotein [Capnocytophaga sp.]|nr:lipoprotein [Capnocytophaga sp.]
MKRLLVVATAVIVLTACSKKSSPGEEEIIPVVEETLDFSLAFAEGTTLNNIITGRELPVVISGITDSHPQADVIYVLTPAGDDATKHQQRGKDYQMVVSEGRGVSVFDFIKWTQINKMEVTDVATPSTFYVQPKVPGTFQLDFELQRYNTTSQSLVGEPVTKTLVFNAVQFNFYLPYRFHNKPGWFDGDSTHEQWYYFSVDDGERENDTYLSNTNISERYEISSVYEGVTKNFSGLELNKDYEFKDSHRTRWRVDLLSIPQTIDIRVVQYLKNGTMNIIEYKKVPLANKKTEQI